MWTPEYFVRLVEFPAGVEGVTIPNDDGTFNVYISTRLSEARRQECLEHELRHIFRDHFYDERPVEDLEREADGLSPRPSPAAPSPQASAVTADAGTAAMETAAEIDTDVFSGKRGIPVFASLEDLAGYVERALPVLQARAARSAQKTH